MNDRLKYKVFDKRDNKLKEIKGYTFSLMELENLVAIQWTNGLYEGNIPIKDLIFCQCTGLKDRNGKLIYEGDIVKINENYCDYSAIEDFYINQNFVVEYFQPRAVYLLKPFEYNVNDGNGIYDLSPDFYEFLKWKPCGKLEEYTLQGIEVIGNIYTTPELLEEQC